MYFNGVAPTGMKDALIYAQSTDTDRTKQSATSQLQGLFGTDLTFPELQPDQYPLVYDADGDQLIRVDGSSCKRLGQV